MYSPINLFSQANFLKVFLVLMTFSFTVQADTILLDTQLKETSFAPMRPTYLVYSQEYFYPEIYYFDKAKNELLNAVNEEQIDQALAELLWLEHSFYRTHVLESVLKEVEEYRAYYETRIHDRFDYGALKKGVGLSAITGILAYGVYAMYQHVSKPYADLQNKAMNDLEKMGVKKYHHVEYHFNYTEYITEFRGYISRDKYHEARSAIDAWQENKGKIEGVVTGQLVTSLAAGITAVIGAQSLYRAFTTDCKKEYERFSLMKSKIEQLKRALSEYPIECSSTEGSSQNCQFPVSYKN